MDEAENTIYRRYAESLLTTALGDTPVVMVTGPRQCGKTTLVREFVRGKREFLTLDDDTTLAAAHADPTGFVRELGTVTIDEIQRAPDLLRAIKKSVDEQRKPGRFLLTGSANLLTVPQVADSLAGRMEIVNLFPLAQAEIHGQKPSFLKAAFEGKPCKPGKLLLGSDLVETVLVGGYPEMLRRSRIDRRQAWARDYIRAIVQRDVKDIAEIEKLEQMPRLLQILAQYSGQLTNFTQIGGQIGFDNKTTGKYVGILEQVFLVRRIEPWFRNELSRLIKTPKLHFLDSGLLATLMGATPERIAKDRVGFGALLETFVLSEVLKHVSWAGNRHMLYHYRDKDQDEVDIIVQDETGALIGIEIKASASVGDGDFKGLRKLAKICGKDFRIGLVLFDGEKSVPFGDCLYAAPLSCLWG